MKNNERIAVLEKQVEDLQNGLATLIKDYKEFIDTDREWSEKIRDAIINLLEFKKRSIEEANKTRLAMLMLADLAGVDRGELLTTVQLIEELDGQLEEIVKKLANDEIDATTAVEAVVERMKEARGDVELH